MLRQLVFLSAFKTLQSTANLKQKREMWRRGSIIEWRLQVLKGMCGQLSTFHPIHTVIKYISLMCAFANSIYLQCLQWKLLSLQTQECCHGFLVHCRARWCEHVDIILNCMDAKATRADRELDLAHTNNIIFTTVAQQFNKFKKSLTSYLLWRGRAVIKCMFL